MPPSATSGVSVVPLSVTVGEPPPPGSSEPGLPVCSWAEGGRPGVPLHERVGRAAMGQTPAVLPQAGRRLDDRQLRGLFRRAERAEPSAGGRDVSFLMATQEKRHGARSRRPPARPAAAAGGRAGRSRGRRGSPGSSASGIFSSGPFSSLHCRHSDRGRRRGRFAAFRALPATLRRSLPLLPAGSGRWSGRSSPAASGTHCSAPNASEKPLTVTRRPSTTTSFPLRLDQRVEALDEVGDLEEVAVEGDGVGHHGEAGRADGGAERQQRGGHLGRRWPVAAPRRRQAPWLLRHRSTSSARCC